MDGDFVSDDPHIDTSFLKVYNSAALQEHANEWWSANYFIIIGLYYASFWGQFYAPPHMAKFVHVGAIDLVESLGIRSGVVLQFYKTLHRALRYILLHSHPRQKIMVE